MPFYVIDGSNSIHNTDNTTLGGNGLQLGAGDSALIQADGSVLATGTYGTGIYVNAYATGSTLVVNGFVYGTSQGIYSLAASVNMTINGQVVGGSTGIGIYGGSLYVSPTGVVSGEGALTISNSSVVNDGTLNGTGNQAIQFSSGWLYNNGLISSTGWGMFYTADGNGSITNAGTIQGDLLTYYAATNAIYLNIDNSGQWLGRVSLTPGDDRLTNSGTISGDVNLADGNNMLDSRYGFIGGSVSAGSGVDSILLGAGDTIITGGGGGDTIDGGAGFDIVSYSGSALGVNVNLLNGTAGRGDAQGDHLSNIEGLYGSQFRDILNGDNGNNLLNGVLGGDSLFGNGGNDTIIMLGGGGNPLISGGTGNDLVQLITYDSATYGYAFRASVQVNGGTGYDTLEVSNAPAMTFNSLTVTNIEHIVVDDGFNYNFIANQATVAAGARMSVDAGSLTGTYFLRFSGAAETDGAYDFTGGAARDIFIGGAGADTFTGAGGRDLLTGGAGSDIFIYDRQVESGFANRDKIYDFDTASDTFQFDVGVTAVDATVSGSVSSASELAALVNGQFGISHAIVVNVTGGTLSGQTLLLVDANGVAGFQLTDYVVEVTGMVGTLTLANFISGADGTGTAQSPLFAASSPNPAMQAEDFRIDSHDLMAPAAMAHAQWASANDGYFLP